LTAAVVTNRIDVAGISLTPGLFAAVRQDMNLRLVGDKQSLRPLGFDEDFDDAVRQALRDMIRWIGVLRGLSKADAYTLWSLAADFRATQMVNMAKGAHCMLPKSKRSVAARTV
jgi:acetamidase/formamidase